MQLMVYLALLLGRVAGRALLYQSVPTSWCFPARAARVDTICRGCWAPSGVRDVFRHYLCFATTILDRTYLMVKRIEYFDCQVHGADALLAVAARREGCLLFGAHLGSFEMLRVLAATDCPVPVQILMYEQNAGKLNSVLRALNPKSSTQVIALGRPQTMLLVAEALARGEIVALLADRVVAGDKFQLCPFLGAEAPFPEGPMILAAALRVFLFQRYIRVDGVMTFFEPFTGRIILPRAGRAGAASRMRALCSMARSARRAALVQFLRLLEA
jgi:predicted LPLAT superfamily acyltransferase